MHIAKLLKRPSQRGDTIVEVLIAMSILAVVLAAAYATSSRSLNAGIDAGLRSQALSSAQQQASILQTVANKNPSQFTKYLVGYPFCVNPATSEIVDVTTSPCPNVSSSQFRVQNTYDTNKKTFTIKASWDTSRGTTDTATLIYKPQNSFQDTSGAFQPPTESNPILPNQPKILALVPFRGAFDGAKLTTGQLALAYQVLSGQSINIGWYAINTTKCHANPSTPTNYPGWTGDYNSTFGTTNLNYVANIGPITQDSSFTMVCSRTGANSDSKTINVGVERITNFTPRNGKTQATALPYQGRTYIDWSAENVNSCSINGVSQGNGVLAGAYLTPNLTSQTNNFTLTCQGDGGPINQTTTVYVTVPAPTIDSFSITGGYNNDNRIYYGGGVTRYLNWSTSNATGGCTASGSWNGNAGTGGSTGVTAYPWSSYTLTCYNSVGASTSVTRSISYQSSSATLYSDTWRQTAGGKSGPAGAGEGHWDCGGNYYVICNLGSEDVNGIMALHANNGRCYTVGGGYSSPIDIDRNGNYTGNNAWDNSFYWYVSWVDVGRDCNGL